MEDSGHLLPQKVFRKPSTKVTVKIGSAWELCRSWGHPWVDSWGRGWVGVQAEGPALVRTGRCSRLNTLGKVWPKRCKRTALCVHTAEGWGWEVLGPSPGSPDCHVRPGLTAREICVPFGSTHHRLHDLEQVPLPALVSSSIKWNDTHLIWLSTTTRRKIVYKKFSPVPGT